MWQMRARMVLIASSIFLPLPVRDFHCMYFIACFYIACVYNVLRYSLSLSLSLSLIQACIVLCKPSLSLSLSLSLARARSRFRSRARALSHTGLVYFFVCIRT